MQYDVASAFMADGTAQVHIGKDGYKINLTGKVLEKLKNHADEEEREHHKKNNTEEEEEEREHRK